MEPGTRPESLPCPQLLPPATTPGSSRTLRDREDPPPLPPPLPSFLSRLSSCREPGTSPARSELLILPLTLREGTVPPPPPEWAFQESGGKGEKAGGFWAVHRYSRSAQTRGGGKKRVRGDRQAGESSDGAEQPYQRPCTETLTRAEQSARWRLLGCIPLSTLTSPSTHTRLRLT